MLLLSHVTTHHTLEQGTTYSELKLTSFQINFRSIQIFKHLQKLMRLVKTLDQDKGIFVCYLFRILNLVGFQKHLKSIRFQLSIMHLRTFNFWVITILSIQSYIFSAIKNGVKYLSLYNMFIWQIIILYIIYILSGQNLFAETVNTL